MVLYYMFSMFCKKGSLVHVSPACAGSGEGSDHFGLINSMRQYE
jgi:hypothetical protein